MTISSEDRKAGPYPGNDTAVTFPFSFKVFKAGDVLVVRANPSGLEDVLTLNTDYTVSLNTDQNATPGGAITLLAVLKTGYALTITSALKYLQPTDLTNQGGFYPKVVTDALDRLTIFTQQLDERVGRSIKLSVSGQDQTLSDLQGAANARANTVVGFDEDGRPKLIPLVVAGSVPLGSQVVEDVVVATVGQTVVYTSYDYTPGTLVLIIDGITLFKDVDFVETGDREVMLNSPLTGGEQIIRVYGFFSPTVSVAGSAVTFRQAGADAIERVGQDKVRERVSPEDFGAIGGGIVDDAPAWQKAVNYLVSIGGGILEVPAKTYRFASKVSVSGCVQIVGCGVYDLENARKITKPPGGSWIIHDSLIEPAFSFTSNLGKGAGLEGLGFFQTGHATPGSGWTPTVHDWVIRNENTQGTLRLDRVHFHNVYRGVNTWHAARPQYENITGQFFYRAFSFDEIYDIGKLDGLHAWTYWSEANSVLQWSQANGVSVTLLRVDGLWMDRIFTFAQSIGLYAGLSSYGGSARVITVNGLYCDFTGRAVVVDSASPAHLFISNLFHLGQAWPPSPTAALAGSRGIDIASGSNHLVQVTNYYGNVSSGESVRVSGTFNQLWIDSELIEQYDYANTGVGAHVVAASNTVHLGSEPHILKVGGTQGAVINGAPAGTVRSTVTLQLMGPDTTNKVITSANATGQLAVVTTEGDANAGIALVAKTTGTVNVGAAGNLLGFYGSAATAKQTGVPITVAGIHAALVSLGLISA